MAQVKLQRKDVHSFGKTIIVPNAEITIDENGVAEMDEVIADLLLAKTDDWRPLEDSDSKDVKDAGEGAKSDEDEDIDEAKEKKDELKSQLGSLTLKEMIELANDSELSEEEIKKFSKNKKLMASFLLKKLA